MIKLNNYELEIRGNNVVTEAEFTLLLNSFYRKTAESMDEEFALEKMAEIAEIAISGETQPHFDAPIDISCDHMNTYGMANMYGKNGDIIKALGIIAGALYRTHVEYDSEESAKQWLAFIGRIAVMSDEELHDSAHEILN